MKRKILLVILVLFAFTLKSTYTYGQLQGKDRLDSLLVEFNSEKYSNAEDTNKVKLLNSILWGNSYMSIEEAMQYADIGIKLTKKLNWKKGESDMYNSMGKCYASASDYPNAMTYYKKALLINEEIGNKRGVAANLCNIGIIALNTGDHTTALEYYFKALKLDKELGLRKYTANVLGNIGVVYSLQGNDIAGLNYYIEALAINESLKDKAGMASNLDNIGIIYYSQKDYGKALEYYKKAFDIYEELEDVNGTIIASYNIGSVYKDRKDLKNALDYYKRSLQKSDSNHIVEYLSAITGSIGEVYTTLKAYKEAAIFYNIAIDNAADIGDKGAQCLALQQKGAMYLSILEHLHDKQALSYDSNFPVMRLSGRDSSRYAEVIPTNKSILVNKAIRVLTNSLTLAKEVHEPTNIMDAYGHLAKAYKIIGNCTLALDATEHFVAIQDSLFSKDKREAIMKLGLKNEYDRKHLADSLQAIERQNIVTLKLQKQRNYTYMGVGGALLLVLFSVFMLRSNKLLGREKKRSDDLLLNILPAEVATELKEKGSAEAKMINEVTVLFTDFKGFTQISERLSPKALVNEINTCFSVFDKIMQKHGIEKIKTIGDAYMAAGGLPTPNKTHATDVVNAAIEIQQYMQEHKRQKEALGELFFEIRIGIHTGPVVAGIVGIKKFAYDIWGDTVNTASRMESSGQAGAINISQTTYDLVKDKFDCEYRGEIDAKNKGKLKMYFVSAKHTA